MSAYSICPPSSGVGTGIVTKATSNGGRAPYGAGAYQVFTAPPGTQLVDVKFNVGAIKLNWDWSVGIVAFGGDWDAGDYPYGCYPWTTYCGVGTPVFSIQAAAPLFSHARFRFQTRCVNQAGCDLSASPFNPANQALFSAANVVVRVRDEVPPVLSPARGALWNGGWHRGYEEAWTNYSDGSGIMVSRLYVDGVVRQTPRLSRRFDARLGRAATSPARDHASISSPAGSASTPLTCPTARTASTSRCSTPAAIPAMAGQTIRVDNTIPAKPEAVTVGGGEGWRSANRFDLGWQNPPGQVAPIVRAHYRLCPARGGECIAGAAETATASPH